MNRIAKLPGRDWTASAPAIAATLTDALRTNAGTMRLRPVQGAALAEIERCQGAFLHILVGGGKTIISGLAAAILKSSRPMLLVPGKLVDRTYTQFEKLRLHWQIPHSIQIVSYSRLGRSEHHDLLEAYQPDLIVADEGHKLKRVTQSAVARRVARYMSEHPTTRFVCMSGTLTKGSILDYAHLLTWALRSRAPVPANVEEQALWASVLDAAPERADEDPDLDALTPALGVCRTVREARARYCERLTKTPGVIITADQFDDVPLRIHVRDLPESDNPDMIEAWQTLRKFGEAPDGWIMLDQFEMWRAASEMSLGFCYIRDPRPPKPWFDERRKWARFIRQTIAESGEYDSPKQVEDVVTEGALYYDRYDDWKRIEPTYVPHTVPHWLSEHAIDEAIGWALEAATEKAPHGTGLIWCKHSAFAERLRDCTGWPYYASKGIDARTGVYIEDADPDVPAIVSVDANLEGRDLQFLFSRNLFTSPLDGQDQWEQALGRTHRPGQTSPVAVTIWIGCPENERALAKALVQADYAFQTTGQEHKLRMAEWV